MVAPTLFPITGEVQPGLVYHFHEAPVPSEPPETLSADEVPEEMVVGFAVTPVGEIDTVFIDTVALIADVVLHDPSART
jgi:hypothetical protein